MPHISVLTFFGCVFLAFVLGMSAGAWVYQRIFTWKYQKLRRDARAAWDRWTPDDIRDDLASIVDTAHAARAAKLEGSARAPLCQCGHHSREHAPQHLAPGAPHCFGSSEATCSCTGYKPCPGMVPQRPLGAGVGAWDGKPLPADPDEHAMFAVRTSVDAIEAALAACKHPYHADGYCITCGARNFGGTWAAPHWRDLLVDAHVFVVGDLGLIRGPIRKENHGSTEKSNDKEEV